MATATSLKEKRNGQFSTDEARQLIQDEVRQRAEACLTAIDKDLKDHNCELVCLGQLRSGIWVPITDGPFVAGSVKVIPR